MSNLTEQISEMSADLLLRAVGELGQIAYNAANFVRETGASAAIVARTQMLSLINSLRECNVSKKN